MDSTVIFMHIPKCGGTTLHAILRDNFPEDRRFYINGSDIAGSRAQLASLPVTKRRKIDLLHGHMCFGWHELLPRDAIYFTMVRHPVDRCVSHYNYVRFRADHSHYLQEIVESEKMTISEYISSGVCDEMNNGQVRLLAGVEDIVQEPYGDSALRYGTNAPELLERAIQNIDEHFTLVGLQERYDQSLLLLKDRIGLQDITYRSRNVGAQRYEKVLPTAEDIRVIKRYNQLDLALYETMQERFTTELRQLTALHVHLGWLRMRNWAKALISLNHRVTKSIIRFAKRAKEMM